MEAPGHDVLLATVRDFADRSGAQRVVVVLDRGPDRLAPTIEAEKNGDLTIAQGDESFLVPPQDLLGVEPLHVHMVQAVPPSALSIDTVTDQIEAPIGVMDALAQAVRDLAVAMGGRSIAQAEFGTRSGQEIALTARVGESVVVSAGDSQYEL